MEIRRTVPVKLDVSDSAAESLFATIDEFRFAANCVVNRARRDDGLVETSKQRLHERTYDEVRERTDGLHANLVQAARSRAADALKGVVSRWSKGEYASLPTFTAAFAEYDKRSATFHDDRASLSTLDGRVTVEYVLPDEDRDTPHAAYLFNDDFETTGATLHYRPIENVFYLHVRTKAVVDGPEPPENGTVLGVDLGVENTAVTSTGMFWSSDELNHWHREYERRRASMQQRGTRYAHEAIQRVSRGETDFFKQHLNRAANAIVREALSGGCSHIAFEDLTDIRDRMPKAKKFHTWAFHRLYEYVSYKAEARGISVEQVNPAYTSQRCSTCGSTAKGNRSGEHFRCQKCGYTNHADYNAAKNIGLKLLPRRQNEDGEDAPVGVRVNTGMMNTNGLTSVPSESVRVGVHGESPRR